MINECEYLVSLTQQFIDKKIALENFNDEFENYFFNHEEVIYEYKEFFNAFNKIRDAIAYYQPSPEIRKSEPYLLDEEQLFTKVKAVYEQIKN